MKLVIIDRDGTLNAPLEDFGKSVEEWNPLPGALEAVARLNHAGYHVVIATHQPELGRGLVDMAALNAVHAQMHKRLAAIGGRIDAVFLCPHVADEACHCRPPLPGLFEQIAERFGMPLTQVPVVSASADLLSAAAAAGGDPQGLAPLAPGGALLVSVHADLAAFAESLIERDARARQPASA